MIKALLQRWKPLQGDPTLAPTEAWPRESANDPLNEDEQTELQALRREVYEQRIRITGLSKKLRNLNQGMSTLKVRWPAIHNQIFPQPRRKKRT